MPQGMGTMGTMGTTMAPTWQARVLGRWLPLPLVHRLFWAFRVGEERCCKKCVVTLRAGKVQMLEGFIDLFYQSARNYCRYRLDWETT